VPAANADFGERMIDPKILHVTRVPGMDHFVPWSNPELIRDAILRHLPPAPAQGAAKP